ncbi:MAG TPA: alpha/beta fold hydrolase [Candidatus Dormibacteraeota bacterium]|nr:alpha/beta fold hydrolase [Candidatus Dormibacteraeota bacterium]
MEGGTATRRRTRGQNGRARASATAGDARTARAAASPSQSPAPAAPESVEERATEAILGANPFLGIDRREQLASLRRLALRLGAQPGTIAREGITLGRELAAVVAGRSAVEPARGDRRFADTTWRENPAYHRLMQGYLAWSRSVDRLVDGAGLDWRSTERARFATTMLTEAVAPTNALPGNPAALKRGFETGGRSLVRGARNLLHDVRHNGGMPAQVDRTPFVLGENIALSRGAVVFRSEVCELIQFTPTTAEVGARPLVMIPPQINKYYIMDLAPGRSFIENAVANGVQFFSISWRNPGPEHRDWDLDTYVQGCLDSIGAACEITGSDDVNVMGLCAGGITTSITLAHMAAAGDPRVHSVTLPVTMLDMSVPSTAGIFSSERVGASATRESRRRGVLSGREMSRVFAWMRPNDLVWNYWVNNYLMGNPPPAFDILAWNNDTTNLPAALHAQFIRILLDNALTRPGELQVLGTPIDLGAITAPAYVLAGVTDHITPWRACYRATGLLGGESSFVLSNSGHIQALVNPPGNPKASYFTGPPPGPDPDAWRAAATEHRDSWWGHWLEWLGPHCGARRPAAERLGSRRHPPMEAAPGTYVHDQA